MRTLMILIPQMKDYLTHNKYVWKWLLVIGISFIFVDLFAADAEIIPLWISGISDPVEKLLYQNELEIALPFYAHIGLPCALILLYLYSILISPYLKRKRIKPHFEIKEEEERRAYYLKAFKERHCKSDNSFGMHLFYITLITLSLYFMSDYLDRYKVIDQMRGFHEDLRCYRQNELETFEGSMSVTKEPLDITNSMKIQPLDGVVYFQFQHILRDSGREFLSCYDSVYVNGKLSQPYYKVQYLPYSKILVSLKDNKDTLLTDGKIHQPEVVPEGYWMTNDWLIKKHEEDFGYAHLTEDEKWLYDVFCTPEFRDNYKGENENSDYFLAFYLEDRSYPESQFEKVLAFYTAQYPNYEIDPLCFDQYGGHDDSIIVTTKLSAYMRNDILSYDYYREINEMADEVVDKMPKDLKDEEKCAYLCQYLVNRGTPMNNVALSQKGYPEDLSDPLYENGPSTMSSSYQLLVGGYGTASGYAKAFDLLAKKAGLEVITVRAESGYSINAVKINDKWYMIDSFMMDGISGIDYHYFLKPSETLLKDHPLIEGELTFGTTDVLAPECTDNAFADYCPEDLVKELGKGIQNEMQAIYCWKLPDFKTIKESVAYQGLRTSSGVSKKGLLPNQNEKEEERIERWIKEIMRDFDLSTVFWYDYQAYENDIEGYEEEDFEGDPFEDTFSYDRRDGISGKEKIFLYYWALTYTQPVSWSKPEENYMETLAPIPAYILYYDQIKEGILQEHFDQSVQLLSGDAGLKLKPKAFYNVPGRSRQYRYDATTGVFFQSAKGESNPNEDAFFVEDLKATAEGYTCTVKRMPKDSYEEYYYEVGIIKQEDGSFLLDYFLPQ